MAVERSIHVIIVGAGLGGALMACFLGRAGYQVTVYERRSDPRIRGFVGGRSINLALSARGIEALRRIGLDQTVLANAVRMPGRMMHDIAGRLTSQPYSADPAHAINSISRGGLNITLLEAAAEHPNVSLAFEHGCIDVDLKRPAATLLNDRTNEEVIVEADLILGADGAYSAVRSVMQKNENFNYSQDYLSHGYKELTIPPAVECGVDPAQHGGFAMEPHALHIWPRGQSMMIALPNQDRTFTCTLFWPYEGAISFDAIRGRDDVKPFFEKHFPDAVPLMPTLVEDYLTNPVGPLVTIRCNPWQWSGKVALLGDAAHAVVPFYGQGMNAAFEDCVVLDECLRKYAPDLAAALSAYQARRIDNANAIADMALANFIEMRDKVASRVFLARKKLEHALHRLAPGTFMPRYDMVSFTTIPYAEAQRRGRRNARIVTGIGIMLLASPLLLFLLLLICLL